AGTYPLRRRNQSADRIGELGGEMDADRYRGDEKQHRHQDENHREGDLKPRALSLQALVLRGGEMGLVARRQHAGLDKAADIEVEVAELVEPNQRTNPLLLVVGDDNDLALMRAP